LFRRDNLSKNKFYNQQDKDLYSIRMRETIC
jgi:hypothetical protein